MLELVKAMKDDAADQDKLVAIVAELLEEIVTRNDQLKVYYPCLTPVLVSSTRSGARSSFSCFVSAVGMSSRHF